MFLILIATTLSFLIIAGRIYYRHHCESQDVTADYANNVIVPQRGKKIHVDSNVAYDRFELEKRDIVDASETDCDRASMVQLDDGYPVMQETGDVPYMEDPKVASMAKEQCT